MSSKGPFWGKCIVFYGRPSSLSLTPFTHLSSFVMKTAQEGCKGRGRLYTWLVRVTQELRILDANCECSRNHSSVYIWLAHLDVGNNIQKQLTTDPCLLGVSWPTWIWQSNKIYTCVYIFHTHIFSYTRIYKFYFYKSHCSPRALLQIMHRAQYTALYFLIQENQVVWPSWVQGGFSPSGTYNH